MLKSPGQSESAVRKRFLKQNDPEKYARLLERERLAQRKKKKEREEYWANGTRAALEDKEKYRARERQKNQRYSTKKRAEAKGLRVTRNSFKPVNAPRDGQRRCDMTPEDRRKHDNEKRRQARASLSHQKKTALKAASAAYMRAYRLSKKLCKSVEPGPSTGSAQPGPSSSEPAPSVSDLPDPLAAIGWSTIYPSSKRLTKAASMRQYCYNVCSKIKSTLKNGFNATESANMAAKIVLRRTPDKRRANIDRLLEHPEVRQHVRRRLGLETKGKARKVPNKQYERRKTTRLIKVQRKVMKARYKQTDLDIIHFYKNSGLAKVLPHKRYATKAGAGYVLLTTLNNLHKSFMEATGKKVSFSHFASLRPRHVRKLGSVPTETCLCVACTNIRLKIEALNRKLGANTIPPEGKMVQFLLCPFRGSWPRHDCIMGKCHTCEDRIRPFTVKCWACFHDPIQWLHWERRPIDGKTKLDITSQSGTVGDLLEQLSLDLVPRKGTTFILHLFRAYWQFSQYTECKNTLKPGQVMIVQDFAENRKATYNAEVKSAHFGKAQIALHPAVCFYKNLDGQLVRHVQMFMSDDIGHDYHAVHTFTRQSIELLKIETSVKEVIIWSDGAASQYKGRGTFADLSLYPLLIQRNFFGSEHGKGESDGETGRFSQAMARAVASGANFKNAQDMVDFGNATYASTELKKYTFIHVPLEEIVRDRPETDVATLPGTRSIHQLVQRGNYVLAARDLSCFCSGCQMQNAACCVSKDYVKQFDIFKLKPSAPLNDAMLDEEEETEIPEPTYTSDNTPQIGQWLSIIGCIETKKSKKELSFFATVIPVPEGAPKEHFYVQFLKKTSGGSYVMNPGDVSQISTDINNYRWRVVQPPRIDNRGHHFFL